MLGMIKTGTNYVNISVCCQKSDGTKEDPSAIDLTIYLVSQADGTLSSVATETPAKQDGKTGFYGWSEDISAYVAGQYLCLVEATVDSIDTHWTDSFFVNPELATIDSDLDQSLSTTESNIRGPDSDNLKDISDQLDDFMNIIRYSGTLTTDGTEQDIKKIDAPSDSIISQRGMLDLSNMESGDTIVIREYYRIKSGGSYILLDAKTLSGAQAAFPSIDLTGRMPNRYGFKLTLEQTATGGGGYKNFDWEVFCNES